MSLGVDEQLVFLKDDHLPPYLPFTGTDFWFPYYLLADGRKRIYKMKTTKWGTIKHYHCRYDQNLEFVVAIGDTWCNSNKTGWGNPKKGKIHF